MTIAAVLREKGNTIVSVMPQTPIMDIVATMSSRRIGAVLVLDGEGVLDGIISERDVVKTLAQHGPDIHTMQAADIMTRAVTTVTPDTSINHAMELMDQGYFRHLPVMDDGRLVGIISVRDVVRARIELQDDEAQSLRSYIHYRG